MTTTTLDGLLAAIIESPDDDDLRLVYADCLEEDGQDARAEFVRVQVELAKCPPITDPANHGGSSHGSYLRFTKLDCHWCKLARREYELMSLMVPQRRCWYGPSDKVVVVEWSRGFPEVIGTDTATWMEHGPVIARATPLRRVTLSGKWPHQYLNLPQYRWADERFGPPDDADGLPRELARTMRRMAQPGCYATVDEALAALSQACIAWAKAQPLAIVDAQTV